MIRFENVTFAYKDLPVLNDISFTMKDGEFVGILGPNGGGKSTFICLALGLLKPQKGKIEVNEKKISYISQTTSLSDTSFPATVEEAVSLGLVDNRIFFHYKNNKKLVNNMLKKMNLLPYKKMLVNELSGGLLQRVKIAKALISNPTLVVLDEPDAGMDSISHNNLISMIEELHKNKIGILFVSHHPEDLKEADNIFFIEDNKIMTYEEELKRGHHHVDL